MRILLIFTTYLTSKNGNKELKIGPRYSHAELASPDRKVVRLLFTSVNGRLFVKSNRVDFRIYDDKNRRQVSEKVEADPNNPSAILLKQRYPLPGNTTIESFFKGVASGDIVITEAQKTTLEPLINDLRDSVLNTITIADQTAEELEKQKNTTLKDLKVFEKEIIRDIHLNEFNKITKKYLA